ncbi:MAG: rRNA pseudouridine synthase [Oscillospiraceae bacterium]|nr:rRNA pseudouridine synthase [Oscillospiraceae bacterium]
MKERIQKIIASRGVTSRRNAEKWIVEGRVTCNGLVCQLGDTADDNDAICIDGTPLPSADRKVYLMLNKPKGFVTTLSDERGRKNAAQLVADCGIRIYPVGRLDMDSEGLLLFTNDGAFANEMMHPKHEVNKTYRVLVDGFAKDSVLKLQRPIVLDGYRIQPPEVELLKDMQQKAELLITIHEGRNRQVRRMCIAAGMKVRRLVRVSEGSLQLGNLQPGKWRYLTDEELQSLWKPQA